MAQQSPEKRRASLPEGFWRIRLYLAREPGFPDGSREIGYDLVVPLKSDARIDTDAWDNHRQHYRFVHFRPDRDDESGHLIRRPGGSWAFHYDIHGEEDDAAGFRFQDERFVAGEYVSIREHAGNGSRRAGAATRP